MKALVVITTRIIITLMIIVNTVQVHALGIAPVIQLLLNDSEASVVTPDVLFYVDDGYSVVGKTFEQPSFCGTAADFSEIINIRDAEGPGSDGVLPQFRGSINVFFMSGTGRWGIDLYVDSFGFDDLPTGEQRIRGNCSEGDIVEPRIIEAGWLQVSYTLIGSVLTLKLLN